MALVLCAWTLGLQSGVPALRPSRPRPRPVLLAADAARLIEENERLIRHATVWRRDVLSTYLLTYFDSHPP